jgi:hypothetical protein
MVRTDNSNFLLYIEPLKEYKSEQPISDELVGIMKWGLLNSKRGLANYSKINEFEFFFENLKWFGFHNTDDGNWSTNHDLLLPNGMITNSLGLHYLKHYRNIIPQSELNKVYELVEYYKNNINKKREYLEIRFKVNFWYGESEFHASYFNTNDKDKAFEIFEDHIYSYDCKDYNILKIIYK